MRDEQKSADPFMREMGERLRIARTALGLDQPQMAEKLGAAARTYAGYERGETEPRGGHLKRLIDLGVDPHFLFKGIGVPLSSSTPPPAAPTAHRVPATGSNPPVPEGFILVPRYDVEASAGHGALIEGEHVLDFMAFQESWVRRALRVDPKHLALITATGDSMEPSIRSGDLLLVDTSVDRVMDDSIYLISHHDILLVKRIQLLFNGIVVKSDNSNYIEMTLTSDEMDRLLIRGRIRWIGRLI